MQSGELTEWIEIQRKQVTKSPTNGRDVVTWVPFVVLPGSPTEAAPIWAQFVDLVPSRNEGVRQGLDVSVNVSRVRIPYLEILRTVSSAMRVIRKYEDDNIYQIIGGPAIIGQREWIEIICQKDSVTP